MTKIEFLEKLEKLLAGLPRCDVDSSVEYWGEMIEDKIEEGMSEEEAVEAVGTPERIAEDILRESPVQKTVEVEEKPKKRYGGGEITLLILGFTLWFPLLIAALAVVFALVVALWSVFVSLAVSALACFVVSIIGILTGQFLHSLAVLAASLITGGLAMFVLIACMDVTRGMWWLTKGTVRLIKRIFVGRGKK